MTTSTIDKVRRLVRAATGEEWGDGYVVTDVVKGYAEPGYGDDDDIVVFGNWNPKRFPRGDDAPLTKAENIGPRLAGALEQAGAKIEWLDEWTTCAECYRALRTQADSYSWQMYGAFLEDGDGYYCADCLRRDDIPQHFIDNADTAVTWLTKAEMVDKGWTQYELNNPQSYANGWYEGQNDDPRAILKIIRRDLGDDISVVFLIDSVGQFDLHFSAWYRELETDDDDDCEVTGCCANGGDCDHGAPCHNDHA